MGEVSPKVTERARTLTGKHRHSDRIALTKTCLSPYVGSVVPGLPSQALRASSPKGRALGKPVLVVLDA